MRSTDWWKGLSATDQHELGRRLRHRDDVIVARFVEPQTEDEPVPSDFYEYLVNHEVYLEDGPTFHICSAHTAARAEVERGRIAHDFRCPLARATCPLRHLLARAPGQDCLLRLGRRPLDAARNCA